MILVLNASTGGDNMTKEDLRKIRLDLKLTQQQLAERLGFKHHTTIGYLESGRSKITRRTINLYQGLK